MTVLGTEPKDPPHILCLSMTQTEDRILRELHKNGGEMSSEKIRGNLVLTECTDNIYGAITALREMGYIETVIIDWNDWRHHYRPLSVTLTLRGRRHVLDTEPVRTGWTRVFLSLILVGALIAAIQAIDGTPDYGPIGVSMLAAGAILLLARRFGQIMTRKR